ncbi:hypothetical protein D9619_010377 [Psilocybe cf. subviscida]|uniref:HNH nuclease domain-containing protein n=1 Tax=Psilocybe cf. subviscida TaxID=2480587 RepID=A0A8H5ASL2_9AGAR|nr:hypothetical protein D9619_010377 [Psilocybe cf. subviscida]
MSSLLSHNKCHFNANGNQIWALLLEAEQEALTKSVTDQPQYDDSLIAIRVLGFLLKDLWTNARKWNLGDTAYSKMVEEINTIDMGRKDKQFDALVELGLIYRNRLFQVFHCNAGPGPTPSRTKSRSTLDVMRERIIHDLKNTPPTKYNVRKQALLRDGFKCVVSGIFDLETWSALSPDAKPLHARERLSYTQTTSLFPQCVQGGPKESSASAHALLSMFGLESQATALAGAGVDSLHNLITLETSLHAMFDTFDLWLEPVEGQEHTYEVCCPIADERDLLVGPLPSHITLRVEASAEAKAAEENLVLGLPDPHLMAVRAICARVANLSGATRQMERILADIEDSTVLADNGSMATLLATRLAMISG